MFDYVMEFDTTYSLSIQKSKQTQRLFDTQDYSLNLEVRESQDSKLVAFDMPVSNESYFHVYVSVDDRSSEQCLQDSVSSSLLLAGLGLLAFSRRKRYYRTR